MNLTLEITAAAAIALTALFLWRRQWGLYALIFALPFERFGAWALNPFTGHPVIRASQLIGLALIAAFGLSWLMQQEKLKFHRVFTPLLLFVISAGLSFIYLGHKQLLVGWAALVFVALLCFVVAQVASRVKLAYLLNALFASTAAVSLFGLYQFIGGAIGLSAAYTGLRPVYERAVFGFPRVQSTALEPLYFANYLLIPLLIGASFLLLQPRVLRVWQKATLAVAFLAFILTMSRGAFAAIIPAFLLIIVLGMHYKQLSRAGFKKFLAGTAVLFIIAVGLVGFAAWFSQAGNGVKTYFQQITSVASSGSFTERAHMRQEAIKIFNSHPLLGVGVEGITPYLRGYGSTRTPNDVIALNNQFFELLAETGIAGAALFYGFLAALFYYCLRFPLKLPAPEQAWVLGLMAVVAAITIQAQSFSGFLLTQMWVCFGLLIAVMLRRNAKAS